MSTEKRAPPPQVGALLRAAHEDLIDEIAAGLIAQGFDDVRPHHISILRRLLFDEQRPSVVAARLGLSKQAVNDLLRTFEERGYLMLVPDPDDGRAKRVRATDRGWDLVLTASRLSAGVGQRWKRQVGAERYAVFEEVLRDIVAAGDGSRSPAPGRRLLHPLRQT